MDKTTTIGNEKVGSIKGVSEVGDSPTKIKIPTREELKKAPDSLVKAYHNEYIRRWKGKNKDKVNSYQREGYKKKNHVNNMVEEKGDHSNTIKEVEVVEPFASPIGDIPINNQDNNNIDNTNIVPQTSSFTHQILSNLERSMSIEGRNYFENQVKQLTIEVKQ